MNGEAAQVTVFLDLTAAIEARDGRLTPIQAAILAAAELGIASDSRSFAKILDIAHAIVLREINALAERDDLLRITKRDQRTMRAFYELIDPDPSGHAVN